MTRLFQVRGVPASVRERPETLRLPRQHVLRRSSCDARYRRSVRHERSTRHRRSWMSPSAWRRNDDSGTYELWPRWNVDVGSDGLSNKSIWAAILNIKNNSLSICSSLARWCEHDAVCDFFLPQPIGRILVDTC